MRAFCRVIVLVVVGLFFCAGFTGCADVKMPKSPFAYADSGFSATVEGTFTRLAPDGYGGSSALVGTSLCGISQPVAAAVRVGPPMPDGDREMSITFTSPTALAGVTVSRKQTPIAAETAGSDMSQGNRWTVTMTRPVNGGILCVDDTAAPGCLDGLLRFADALLPHGDVSAVSPVTNGEQAITIIDTRTNADRGKTTVFFFTADRTLPTRVTAETPGERLELVIIP